MNFWQKLRYRISRTMISLVIMACPWLQAQNVPYDCAALNSLTAELARAGNEQEQQKIIAKFVKYLPGNAPIIEGTQVTFVVVTDGREQTLMARRVEIFGDFTGWGEVKPMHRLTGTDLYWFTLTGVPRNARIEYKFKLDEMDILDELNPVKVDNGVGGENSLLVMPDYRPLSFTDDATIPHGAVKTVEFKSEILGNRRAVHIYTPPGYAEAGESVTYPVIYVHDGTQYLQRARMARFVDFLIAVGKIEKLVLVFVDPVDRSREYSRSPEYTRLVVEELIPYVRKQVHITDVAAKTACMGASLGGLIAFHLGFSHPEIFGLVISQSGAFGVPEQSLFRDLEAVPVKPLKLYFDIGIYDLRHDGHDLLEDNRKAEKILRQQGYDYLYYEYSGGHNWNSWQDQFPSILEYLFKK